MFVVFLLPLFLAYSAFLDAIVDASVGHLNWQDASCTFLCSNKIIYDWDSFRVVSLLIHAKGNKSKKYILSMYSIWKIRCCSFSFILIRLRRKITVWDLASKFPPKSICFHSFFAGTRKKSMRLLAKCNRLHVGPRSDCGTSKTDEWCMRQPQKKCKQWEQCELHRVCAPPDIRKEALYFCYGTKWKSGHLDFLCLISLATTLCRKNCQSVLTLPASTALLTMSRKKCVVVFLALGFSLMVDTRTCSRDLWK